MGLTRLTRREAIRTGMGAGLAAAVGTQTRTARAGSTSRPRSEVRNVIFMISDGMSAGVPSMTEAFARVARGRGTWWYELRQHPETTIGDFETHSLSSLVTDSAAAASAYGSGSRVFNSVVNCLPDGTGLVPIGALVRSTRRRVGLVTTTAITDATPAGFAAVEKSRGNHDNIADQYLNNVDVLMGGGRDYFDPGKRKDKKDLLGSFKAAGYACWTRRKALLAGERPAKILGLFGGGALPFTVDHRHDAKLADRVPSLAEMTRVALESLNAAGEGFLLQVEGARIDHAAHANDAAALLWDQLAFDDAIGVALEFTHAHPDTLLVITTDHGNSNPGLRGMGGKYADTRKAFERLAEAKGSFETVQKRFKEVAGKASSHRDTAGEILRAIYGFTPDADEAEAAAQLMAGKVPFEMNRQLANAQGILGQIVGNHTGVGFNGTNHTEDLAMVLAVGARRTEFAGLLRNTDAFARVAALFDIHHRNPSMTADQARRFVAQAPAVDEPHWV